MLVIKDRVLNTVMSRDAKTLRDDILQFCLDHCSSCKDPVPQNEFIDKLLQQYSPISWERAVLFAKVEDISNAIRRRTSNTFYTKDKEGEHKEAWQKGSVDGNRYKLVNWLEIAKFEFNSLWWKDSIQFPRTGYILVNAFDNVRDQFVPMYTLFSRWFIIDFSWKTLLRIFDLSLKYQPEFVQRCMEKVEDKSKRSIEYLLPIIDKEFVLMRDEILEREHLNKESVDVLTALMEIKYSKTESVNWGDIDNVSAADSINLESFDKVKLS